MCGILGWVGPPGRQPQAAFEPALQALAHRGPDDQGIYQSGPVLLGHRRLSIIDLTQNGHQPMQDPGSGAVIVFNGEIYNYPELRKELEGSGRVFRTDSDTEVLLQAYLHWGAEALGKLNGMWAFAVWRPDTRKLFMARDRFGVKPFYHLQKNGEFAFASEPKALLTLFPQQRQPDDVAVYEFLAEGKLYSGRRSFYQGISTLPPGHYAEYDASAGTFHERRYWDYPSQPAQSHANWDDAVQEFSALFDDAVRLRTRSDVPVGVTLSGGLDSTAVISSIMRHQGAQRICFTSVYGERDRGETRWAELALQPYGMKPVEVEAPQQGWLETLDQIAWHMDGPGYSPAVYPLWHLMREARRQGVYVLLEGQGADEELGGYPQYAILSLLGLVRQVRNGADLRQIRHVWQRMCATFTRRWVMLWMAREMFPSLVTWHRGRSGAYQTLSEDFRQSVAGRMPVSISENDSGLDAVTKRLRQDHASDILPGLLQYGDAISMAHGVESRLPFLDFRLVEWLFRQGAEIKIREGETKWVLRQYLQRAGQGAIARRKDKMGYPTPAERWMSENDGQLVKELLLVQDARIRRFCSAKGVERLLRSHLAGHPASGNHLYRLLSLELWMRRCL